MEIYLMRHAQTVVNKKGKYFCSYTETELSEEGKNMCKALSNLDIWNDIDRIYITPLKRTHETAKLILNNRDIEMIQIDEFAELNFGDYEGKILTEENKDDPIFKQWLNDCNSLTFPNGENIVEHAEVCFSKLKEIAESNPGKNILIVSHSTTIRTLITKILNININTFRKIPCSNTSLTKLNYENGVFSVEYLNTPLNSINL